jgi:hypothetical protein
MKIFSLRIAACAVLLFGASAHSVAATDYIDVNVVVVNGDDIVLDSTEYIPDSGCTITDNSGTDHTLDGAVALCALNAAAQSAGLTLDVSDSSYGLFLNGIGDTISDSHNAWYWTYYVNGDFALQGIADTDMTSGDNLTFAYGYWTSTGAPLTVELSDTQVVTDKIVTATVMKNEGAGYVPAEDATVYVNDWEYTTDARGEVEFGVPRKSVKTVFAELEGFTRTTDDTLRVYTRHAKKKKLKPKKRVNMARRGLSSLQKKATARTVSASPSLRDWALMAFAADGQADDELAADARSYNARSTGYSTEVARNVLALSSAGKMKKARAKSKQLVRLQDPCSDAFVNDEIYTVLALRSSSTKKRRTAVKRNARCAMNAQKRRGGVPLSTSGAADIDTTAAFVQMLSSIEKPKSVGLKKGRVNRVRKKSLKYLRRHQNPDGGWGYTPGATSNSSSTAYALMAFQSADKKAARVRTNKRNGFNYLKRTQRASGAFKYDTNGSSSVEELNTTSASMSLLGKWLPVNRAR